MFTFKNVRYRNILGIEDLTIPAFQTTCIVGESGSGKTTLLKLLNNLLTCDQGEIFYKGKDIARLDPVRLRREVVMLPQTPLIFPGTVKDNLLAGLYFAEKPLVEGDLLIAMLDRMRLKKDLAHNAAELSGGEKQRLAICRIMLMEPEVFLLDEPTSALDDSTEEMAIEKLIEFARQKNKTLVMITHSKNIARQYGELIITLREGKISGIEEAEVKYG
ncbi:MAG: ATP-binding cassette domain-containing protein [Bacillota bacterium]